MSEFHVPLGLPGVPDVLVCDALSWLVQRKLPPTANVTDCGLNAKPEMFT